MPCYNNGSHFTQGHIGNLIADPIYPPLHQMDNWTPDSFLEVRHRLKWKKKKKEKMTDNPTLDLLGVPKQFITLVNSFIPEFLQVQTNKKKRKLSRK